MDLITIVSHKFRFMEGGNADAYGEAALIGGIGIEAILLEQYVFLPEPAADAVDILHQLLILLCFLGGEEYDVIAVAHAVQIQNNLILGFLLMGLAVGRGADQSGFLQVKEDEADLLPVGRQ